jgi:acetyl esterase/lipase
VCYAISVPPSPQFQKLLGILREQPRGNSYDVARMRAAMERTAFPPADDVTLTPTEVGGVPAEWVDTPGSTDSGAVLLYLHGGGYVMGSLTTHRKLAGDLSRASGARVLLLDYPLAPEFPYPAGIDAAVAAYDALTVDIAPERVAIGGDSAGGGLTLATLLALRDSGRPLPAAGVCISPWADLVRSGGVSADLAAADPVVSPDDLAVMRSWYLGDTDPAEPMASPALADLTGLPPLLIHVGEAEILLEDSILTADKAREAGVDVTMEPWPDMIHVWHVFAGRVPEATDAVAAIGDFLKARLGAGAAA